MMKTIAMIMLAATVLLALPAVAADDGEFHLGPSVSVGAGYGWAHAASVGGEGSTASEGDGMTPLRVVAYWRVDERFAWGAEYLMWSHDGDRGDIDLNLAACCLTWFPEDSAMYARVGVGWGRIEAARSGDGISLLGGIGYLIPVTDSVAVDIGFDLAFIKQLSGTEAHMGSAAVGLNFDL